MNDPIPSRCPTCGTGRKRVLYHKKGPPIRVGEYQINVIHGEGPVLARATLIDPMPPTFAVAVNVTAEGVEAVAGRHGEGGYRDEPSSLTIVPHDVLVALLKIAGMGVEWKRKT